MKFAQLFTLFATACAVGVAPAAPVKTVCTNALMTSWGRAVTPANAWREYPRPRLVRSEWTSLNGRWDYAVTGVATDEPRSWDGEILVPYPIESPLSGVRRRVSPEEQIWYRRTFTVEPRKGCRTILNFERVDFRASVFVNGVEATDVPHEGGNVPFSVDVTDFVRAGENELKVLVWDPTDTHLGGTGKQSLELWTCFFGPCSGICGGVWLETVPETYLSDYRVDTDADAGTVTIVPELKGDFRRAEVSIAVSFGGQALAVKTVPAGDAATMRLPKPVRLWSCDAPNLYDLAITVTSDGRADRTTGYFGMRKVETKLDARGIRRVAVNGKFTYLLATLDQGWWPDGLLTPPSEDACRFDVDFHKKAGFNAIRKHIKIEPRAFYAHCDRIGVMVLQDIPSFGLDREQKDLVRANARYGFYRRELKDCVDHLRNHPSVVMWIPYNEGWGQPSADKTRQTNKWLRRYDPSRLINGPSGWNDYEGGTVRPYANWAYADVADPAVYTDCVDLHHYPDARMHPAGSRRVSFLGEFGGMGVPLEGHVQDPTGRARVLVPVNPPVWRKGQQDRYADLMKRLPELVRQGLGGSVYTEAIDQFWELGGFVTFDRAIVKLDYAFLREIHQGVLDAAREAAETPASPPPPGPAIRWASPRNMVGGEWPRVHVLADGRLAFTYARRSASGGPAADYVIRTSSDRGETWSAETTVIRSFTRPDGSDATVAYDAVNPELAQLPADHPFHPDRLVATANLRPVKGHPRCPSSIGFTVSDDGGRTWCAMKPLLPVAGDPEVRGGRACWEPFVQVLPDGTLHLYYSDVSAPDGQKRMRNVSRFVSRDGGDTWTGPTLTLWQGAQWAGIPSSLVWKGNLYLAHEAHPASHLDWPVRPYVARTSAADPWRMPPVIADPLAAPLAGNEYAGAPYLVQTANYFVLSAQHAVTKPGMDPLKASQLRVWVLPKDKVGPSGDLTGFVPVANPLGVATPMWWNSLAPLGGDEVLACCQRGGSICLVQGRIVVNP